MNNLDVDAGDLMSELADDGKIGGVFDIVESHLAPHGGVDVLVKWVEK